MNVGIATFHWSDNYGAVVQAFAVQRLLALRGHNASLIDFRPPSPSWPRRVLSSTPAGMMRKWEEGQKRRMFEKFRRAYLVRTHSPIHEACGLTSLADAFDALVVGSDQVWNPKWLDQVPGFYELYTLSWASPRVKKVSIAASFGHASTETMPQTGRASLAAGLGSFHALSVREKSGVDLVHELCGRDDATCLADPTLLIDPAEFNRLLSDKPPFSSEIFSYILHGREEEALPLLRDVERVMSRAIIRCDLHRTHRHDGYDLPSPQGWLHRIKNAPLVVTNSFHCTVFCLLFHTPFVAIPVSGSIASMNSRITELLASVGLENRWVTAERLSDIAPILNSAIDWQQVDERLGQYREHGDAFLTRAGL